MNEKQTTVTEKRYGEYYVDDLAITLRAKSASYGGGQRSASHLLYQQTVGAICARDYKGVGEQYAREGKLIIEVLDSV